MHHFNDPLEPPCTLAHVSVVDEIWKMELTDQSDIILGIGEMLHRAKDESPSNLPRPSSSSLQSRSFSIQVLVLPTPLRSTAFAFNVRVYARLGLRAFSGGIIFWVDAYRGDAKVIGGCCECVYLDFA